MTHVTVGKEVTDAAAHLEAGRRLGRVDARARARVWTTALVFAFGVWFLASHYAQFPAYLFSDAHIYYRATEAWVSGANPWQAGIPDILYAAPPPALLLSLPLLPFGEGFAAVFWPVAGAASILYILRRLGLPLWWMFWYPFAEAWAGASPDLVLAALVFAGWGWLAALTKPYSVPAMLADGRWRAVLLAGFVGVLSLLVLPWGQFLEHRDAIVSTFDTQTTRTSAYGDPLLMLATGIALLLLRRQGLGLATPALIAQQPHYGIFSLRWIRGSWLLTIATSVPIPHIAAAGVITCALAQHVMAVRLDRQPPIAVPLELHVQVRPVEPLTAFRADREGRRV